MFYVCAVATQGINWRHIIEYVTNYKVMYSKDDIQWTTYNESGVEKNFPGNVGNRKAVTNSITNPFKAKFVRILPTGYVSHKTMRVDFKGLPSACTSSLGLENSQIPDNQITSHSSSDDYHTAPRGRLYGNSSWCSSNTSNSEYIQVDLGQIKTVTGIATQGDKALDKWVTSYKVRYSFDNRYWNEYKEGQFSKVFVGNTNRKDVIVQWLSRPIAARYVRILPQAWHNGTCVRFDLYGCDIVNLPKAAVDIPQVVLSTPKSPKTIACGILGEPTPDLQWFNDGTKINGATQSTLQVQFTSTEDVASKYNCTRQDPNTRAAVCNTFYTCRATYPNYVASGGIDESSVKVTVNLNVPQAPFVTAVPFQRYIRLSWILPNPTVKEGAISGCLIELNNQSSIMTISAGHQASPFTLTNLKPYTNYDVRMSVKNMVGQGLWSKYLHIKTTIAGNT
ncbi:lactadherin-like [Actinia tenebrosa]|uniref:Lactadherin-like n=1 Tax=Actinia tenebrosa TaxID=6105 RepID=A0A6P8HMZ8_ACTTE|nr:lactadherin-like [Actinia tenebrosa]